MTFPSEPSASERFAALPVLVDELVGALAAAVAASLGGSQAATVDAWRLLNVEEAAERLGRSTRWVRERVKRGDLPYVKLDGGALAFEVDDLRAFAQARRVPLAGRLHLVAGGSDLPSARRGDRVGNRRVA